MSPQPDRQEAVPVAALVVGYQPEPVVLDALLLQLLAEAQLVVLLDNGGAAGYLANHPEDHARVRYIDMQGNHGLGAALNRGMEVARAAGLRYVLTFDQDSEPVAGMAAALHKEMRQAQEQGVPCAAIGPTFYDKRESHPQAFPLYRESQNRIHKIHPDSHRSTLQEVDVLITSGMLVDSDVWHAGLQYNPGLMVEYTDTDWCFRARAAGYRLFALNSARMPHAVSDTAPVRLFGIHLLRYSPLRRYYYFRNTLYFVRRPYVSRAWRRRLLAGLLLRLCGHTVIDPQRFRSFTLSLKGLWHGWRGRLGPYPR